MSSAPDGGFQLFNGAHLTTLAVVVLAAVVVGRLARRDGAAWLPVGIAVLLITQEVVKLWFFIAVYDRPWSESLPLDLCRINEFLCAFMLTRRSFRCFEVAYYWGVGASVAAMITPDLPAGFPDTRFLLFFIGHGLVLVAVVLPIMAWQFRPRLVSVGIALAATGAYALLIAPVNLLLDTNYLFLRAKPEGASILDFFGPWPNYLVALTGIAVATCLVAYLPFAIHRTLHRT
jgi:hypothetical integral membrane protein (TIGR02206 family)